MELVLRQWPAYPQLHLKFVRAWGAGAGVLAQHCATAARLPDPSLVSTTALLARLGALIFGLVKPLPGAEYRQQANELARLEQEDWQWGVSHPVLSEQLARDWALPELLCTMLGRSSDALVQELPDAADKGLIIATTAGVLAAGHLAQQKTEGRILLDRVAYETLKANLKQHKLLDPCLAAFGTPRVQRELAAATE
jgi:HD-like signal output (HDOD) protein